MYSSAVGFTPTCCAKVFEYRMAMTPVTVKMLIMLHGIWYSTPFAMITLFAGLQSLLQEKLRRPG